MTNQICVRPCCGASLFLMAALTFTAGYSSADDPVVQITPLEGLWAIEKNYYKGEELPMVDFQYRFYGMKADFMASGDTFVTYDVTLDLKQNPPHFDLIGERDGTTYVVKGVFGVDGDRLTWSFVHSNDKHRPTLVTKTASGMQILRRIPDLQSERSMPPAEKASVGSKQSSPLPTPSNFEFQLLAAADGQKTIASDINAFGTVLGECGEGASKRACVWKNGRHEVLSGFDLDYAAAYAINDHGTVAGAHIYSAFAKSFYQLDGKLYPMEFDIKFPFAMPYAMNIHRQIVGVSFLPSDVTNSWFWDDGKVRRLTTLGGWSSEAMAINDNGQIAGFSTLNQNQTIHAYLLKGADISDLGTFGGSESKAYDLNQAGEVVGYATNIDGNQRAFLWSNEKLTELPPLASGTTSWAWSINDTGWVVGWSTTSTANQAAVVWHQNKSFGLQKLVRNTDGWHLDIARAVNNAGTIVGTASKNGRLSAFMLKPVIERSRGMEVD